MATSYRAYQPKQGLLLPTDLREWLPAGHLAHHVSDLVDGCDLSAFHARYAAEDGRGNRAHDPRMMVKVLVYGYATGVFSSRRIAAALSENVAFRMLGAGNFPAHRTVCEFRRRHLEDFRDLFLEVVLLAGLLGFTGFGKLSVDGTRIRASASKKHTKRHEEFAEEESRLKAEIGRVLTEARRVDETEDAEHGEGGRGDGVPGGLSERSADESELTRARTRLGSVRGAMDNLEAAHEEALAAVKRGERTRGKRRRLGLAQGNTTDADSRVMMTPNEGFQQSYNAQLAVDSERQLVVAAEVRRAGDDYGALPKILDAVERDYGVVPGEVLADAGYCRERDLADLERRGVDGYVSVSAQMTKRAEANPEGLPALSRMVEKTSTPEGRARRHERTWLSEAPNAWIKRVMGFRQFSVRGLEAVSGEWSLVCVALNIRRMRRMLVTAAPG